MTKPTMKPVERFGEEEQLAQDLDRFEEARGYLTKHRAELTRRYPNQWIAVHKRDILAHSPRLAEVERKIRQMGLHRGHVLLEFLTEERSSLIL
jgi:hypothetical protein